MSEFPSAYPNLEAFVIASSIVTMSALDAICSERQAAVETRVAEFIDKMLFLSGLTHNDIILFERSRKTNTDFVRVAVPEFRHLHIWTNKELFLVTDRT